MDVLCTAHCSQKIRMGIIGWLEVRCKIGTTNLVGHKRKECNRAENERVMTRNKSKN